MAGASQFTRFHTPYNPIYFNVGENGAKILKKITRAIPCNIHTTVGKYLYTTSPPLRIQRHPELTPARRRLCQVNQHQPYGITCNRIENLHGRACRMTFVASKLKLACEQSRKLLVAFKK